VHSNLQAGKNQINILMLKAEIKEFRASCKQLQNRGPENSTQRNPSKKTRDENPPLADAAVMMIGVDREYKINERIPPLSCIQKKQRRTRSSLLGQALK
jgi:hypothetical protein